MGSMFDRRDFLKVGSDHDAADLLVAQFQFASEAQDLLDFSHRQSPRRQADSPFRGEVMLAIVMSSVDWLCGNRSGIIANAIPGSRQKPFAFPPGIAVRV